MVIEGLDEAASVLPFTPLERNAMDEWDTPREFSQFETLSYLFPVGYHAGEVVLQEGFSLAMAIRIVKSCQRYDGGGFVIAITRPRNGGKKVRACPWGSPVSPTGDANQLPNLTELAVAGVNRNV